MKSSPLPDRDQEILKQFEEGRALADTLNSPGWRIVLDLMEDRVAKAEYQLMNYNGCDKEMVTALHRRARDFREFFQELQHDIEVRIAAAHQIPHIVNAQVPGADDIL
jgi:hypothetical protein